MPLPQFKNDYQSFDQKTQLPQFGNDLNRFQSDEEIPQFSKELEGQLVVDEAKIAKQQPIDQLDLSLPEEAEQSAVLEQGGEITQTFGQKSKYDVFSGGVNYGTDIAVKTGTKVAAPPGDWEVVDVFDGAENGGFIGNKVNSGYGNSVLLRNAQTGELVRMSHLSPGINLQKGQSVRGGQVFGRTGSSGNVTGAHLDIEYYNQDGKIADVQQSPYWGSMFSASGGGDPKGFFEKLFGAGKQFIQDNITGTKESRKKERSRKSENFKKALKGDTKDYANEVRKDSELLALGATSQPIVGKQMASQVMRAGEQISKSKNLQTKVGDIARETIDDAFSSIKNNIPESYLGAKRTLTTFDKLEIIKKIIKQEADEAAIGLDVVTKNTRTPISLKKALNEVLPKVTRFQK